MSTASVMQKQATLQSLLQELLEMACRAGDTPLRFGMDSSEIVRTVLAGRGADAALAELGELAGPGRLVAEMDSLVTGEAVAIRDSPRLEDAGTLPARLQGALTGWLDEFRSAAAAIHPQAVEVASLRLAGWGERDIAGQTGLGPRLVARIAADLRADWRRREGGGQP